MIEDLYQRYVGVGAYLERLMRSDSPSFRELANPLRIHGESASKLVKLLRLRHALTAWKVEKSRRAAMGRALDELSTERGADL
jgi:hypothetical protein